MGDGVACWGTLLGGSGFKSRPKYDLFLTLCTSADVPWKKVDTGGQLWPSVYLLMYVCRRILAIFWPFGPFGTVFRALRSVLWPNWHPTVIITRK